MKFETLGCKLNFSETATLGKLLGERGISVAAAGETPDICVVNTCSVTELADRKCRQHIRRLIKLYPDALMVVTGCYAQLKSQEIAEIPGVDIVLGSEQKLDIAKYVEQWFNDHQSAIAVTRTPDIRRFSPSCERGDRTRYWLKVQDGCDYYCSYCTIPMARGRSRSGTIQSLVDQAQQVADEGGKEIVITGVNIGDFGKTRARSCLTCLRHSTASVALSVTASRRSSPTCSPTTSSRSAPRAGPSCHTSTSRCSAATTRCSSSCAATTTASCLPTRWPAAAN